MKTTTILLATMLATGTATIGITAPLAHAKHASEDQDQSSLIKKGMTLDEAQQAVGGIATPVGGARNGVQTYRVSTRQYNGDGGVNDHPSVTVYMFGLKNGKVTWVHKSQ